MPAVVDALSGPTLARLIATFDAHAEAARTVMLHADISEVVLATFERDIARHLALLRRAMASDDRRAAIGAAAAAACGSPNPGAARSKAPGSRFRPLACRPKRHRMPSIQSPLRRAAMR